MILHTTQSQVASDTHRFRVLLCGRRWGKTTLAVQEMVANAISGNDRKIVYIAPTYQQARDIAWQELKRITSKISTNTNESRLEVTVKTTKGGISTIFLRGWEALETLRGQYFHFVVLDEVASFRNFWTGWHEVLRPTLTDKKGDVLFIGTPKGFNHFYDLYNTKDEDFKSFHFTSYDNPHIPSEEIDKAKIEMTDNRFAQEYMADFRKMEGLVYKDFDRSIHVTEQQPSNVTDTFAVIDWGYRNPAAVYRIQKDNDRHYWIDQEFYKTEQTTEAICQYALTLSPNKVYPDHSEADRIDIARRMGLNVREISKDIEAGINTIQELIKQRRIHIHRDCLNLIFEFETYRYPDKKPDANEKEAPIKENDHALDAIRYGLHMEEMSQVQDIIDPIFEQFGTHYID